MANYFITSSNFIFRGIFILAMAFWSVEGMVEYQMTKKPKKKHKHLYKLASQGWQGNLTPEGRMSRYRCECGKEILR